jgi:hypothetical protein
MESVPRSVHDKVIRQFAQPWPPRGHHNARIGGHRFSAPQKVLSHEPADTRRIARHRSPEIENSRPGGGQYENKSMESILRVHSSNPECAGAAMKTDLSTMPGRSLSSLKTSDCNEIEGHLLDR